MFLHEFTTIALSITLKSPYKEHPRKTLSGVYKDILFISHVCSKNIDCRYSLAQTRQGRSNEYSQSVYRETYPNFSSEKKKSLLEALKKAVRI